MNVRARVLRCMAVAVVLAALFISGCSPSQKRSTDAKMTVMVSVLPQAYFVERIAGDRVQVSVMVPPGADPHTYEPAPSQMKALTQARMYVRTRVDFEEAWMGRIAAANKKMLIVDPAEGLQLPGADPHIWVSPRLVKAQAVAICRGLIEVDPEGRRVYEQNLARFTEDLDALDQEISETLSGVRGRKFIVFHPAWSYFAMDYGLEEVPIEIEGKEPSAAELARLIETARSNNIKVVFVQPQFSARSAETIARQIGGKVISLDPLARDWMSNMRAVARAFAENLS